MPLVHSESSSPSRPQRTLRAKELSCKCMRLQMFAYSVRTAHEDTHVFTPPSPPLQGALLLFRATYLVRGGRNGTMKFERTYTWSCRIADRIVQGHHLKKLHGTTALVSSSTTSLFLRRNSVCEENKYEPDSWGVSHREVA